MNGDDSRLPGWYGKIPNLGDFASRRLPSRFIVPWDDWLQRALAGSRGLLGDNWLDRYLTSPVWRFLLLPGVCGDAPWAGVIMPSVDRVGRYFPLSIAAPLERPPAGEADFAALGTWLDALDGAALASLDLSCSADDLDRKLAAHPAPVFAEGAAALRQRIADVMGARGGPATALPLPALEDFGPLLLGAGAQQLLRGGSGKSLWWSRNREGASPLLVCCEGLPAAEDFALLLNGGTMSVFAPMGY